MAEQYTSEQYKYLLMKRLQRHFSMENAKARAYTQSFFWKLFDQSVTVTEEAYSNFVSLMDDQIEYCAANNIRENADITSEMVSEQGVLLIDAFAAIGIGLEITQNGNIGKATFTKPNGEVLVYEAGAIDLNCFTINARANTEYQYARASAPAYNMRDMEAPETVNPKIAGPDTYWSYDAGTAAVTITGSGVYAGATKEEQLGSGAYTTLILGANVSRLLKDSLSDSALTTIVLLHGEDAPLTLDSGVVDTKNTKEWAVYADNQAFRNFAWPYSVKITWYTLEEWEG